MSVKAWILDALKHGPATAEQIAQRAGHPVQPVRVRLCQMCKDGFVERVDPFQPVRYRVTA